MRRKTLSALASRYYLNKIDEDILMRDCYYGAQGTDVIPPDCAHLGATPSLVQNTELFRKPTCLSSIFIVRYLERDKLLGNNASSGWANGSSWHMLLQLHANVHIYIIVLGLT